ncbi:aspartate aminotransferase family protein [Croceibacter atlanticus]|jgi:acetylornithine aminotransferase|uniref:aspartate aminotransferase family protein n=1 Tax=Croceibacter atlanticus TaxID=313588 RepID=UPI000C945440|nr:aspartate aminotransferase family protein [Croceibacter atlanticus]MAM22687.1 aspartate aminotransferase family protein [Croceibacter sp.]HAT70669.1 aspartate aminotransferase family protein [Flavobacteriaceae bacterium]|tara:strand:+ start:419044 stop:420240 length:1197 start_codon:yes stop_codon:yes gene_type:complete
MKDDFITYQAQTTPHPLALEVSYAEGSYIYDTNNKAYLDFVAGVSACSLGHRHPRVINAIKAQLEKYLHVMVYGEYAQEPAVKLSKLLAKNLPKSLNKTYLVNSGTEAIEGALKLARRATGRTEIIAAHKAYHGNTMGSLSLMDFEERTAPFKPLIEDVNFIEFNNEEHLSKISDKTACVILETIQGGAGFILPKNDYLKKVKDRCKTVGALLILDEIQPGFGRTGTLFGFQNFNVVPDIVVMGKGMGGGLPIGAFTASNSLMDLLSDNPKLGHITTFGGNPVIAASALATLQEITETNLMQEALKKEKLFRKLLKHPLISEIRGSGLMLAPILPSAEIASEVILACQEKGLILFWLLFENKALRISPPLTISEEEIKKGCGIIIDILNSVKSNNKSC